MRAAQRARAISAGAELTVDRDRDKNPVVSLREIADETVDINELEEGLIRGLQKHVEFDEPEPDDEAELLAALEQETGVATASEEIAEDVLSIHEESEIDADLGSVEIEAEETAAEESGEDV